jgi:DNA-binding CsgD family transcriptional regulator
MKFVERAVSDGLEGDNGAASRLSREIFPTCDAARDTARARLAASALETLRLLAQGRSLSEIAAALGVAYKTAANVCTQLKEKLGVSRTGELIRLAVEICQPAGDWSPGGCYRVPLPAASATGRRRTRANRRSRRQNRVFSGSG